MQCKLASCRAVSASNNACLTAKHVARLHRLETTKNFRGAIVTGHRTELTIAISDSATAMKMEVQNNAASGAGRKKLGLNPQFILGVH